MKWPLQLSWLTPSGKPKAPAGVWLGLGRLFALLESLYSQLVPLLLMLLTLMVLWVAARNLEPLAYDRFCRATLQPLTQAQSKASILLLDETDLNRLKTQGLSPPWTREKAQQALAPLLKQHPAVIVLPQELLTLPAPLPKARTEKKQRKRLKTNKAHERSAHWVVELPLTETMSDAFSGSQKQWLAQSGSWHVGGSLLQNLSETAVLRSLSPYWVLPALAVNASTLGQHLTLAEKTPVILPSVSLVATLEYLNQQNPHHNELWFLTPPPLKQGWQSWLPHSARVLGSAHAPLQLASEEASRPPLTVPLDETGRYWLRWYRPLPLALNTPIAFSTHTAVSLSQLQASTKPQDGTSFLQNQVVFVSLLPNVGQTRTTVSSSLSSHHLMADIYATAVDNLLLSHTPQMALRWQQGLALLLCCLGTFAIRVRIKQASRALLYSGTLMVGYTWFVLWQRTAFSVLYDWVVPEVFALVGLFMGTLWWSVQRDRQIKSLETTMAQLVPASVFKEIQARKKGLEPGGKRQEMTSMFIDIRDFTGLAENLPASEVTDLLNAFYTVVEAVVFEHLGTVDKYMGDGVLAMFGAPLETPDHAQQALKAAERLLEKLTVLSAHWWQSRHLHFQVGISISSGHAFVGFVGPANKLEYTALGDTVNLCVRLQEQNKQFGVPLVFSHYTLSYLQESYLRTPLRSHKNPEQAINNPAWLKLGEVKVRGRETPVEVYTLASLQSTATSAFLLDESADAQEMTESDTDWAEWDPTDSSPWR